MKFKIYEQQYNRTELIHVALAFVILYNVDMNFHAMLVHFPLALLIVYSLLELLRFKFITRSSNWFYTKATFLVIGVISAYPALSTGGLLEHSPKYDRALVHLHESFASASTNFYLVIAIVYVLAAIYRSAAFREKLIAMKLIPASLLRPFNALINICNNIVKSPLFVILPIIGITLFTITGGLGGVLASGVGVDPIADFVYYLFF